jgi:Glycoside-hydrolase family GH114
MSSWRCLGVALLLSIVACSDDSEDGGAGATGGAALGGGAVGGQGSGAAATGGASSQGGASETGGASSVALPPANAQLDYQLGGAYTPPAGVAVLSRDRSATPEPGLYNICYVNGYQAQEEEAAFWLDEHPDLVLRDENGDPVIDEDWNEMLLDISTEKKRAALAQIVGGWVTQCKADGFDAAEIDNLDSYARSQGLLEEDNAVAFMQLLSGVAHENGLAIAQKNSTELVPRRDEMGTDFAVAEECNRYAECEEYQAGYGDLVFVIEYRQQDFDTGCAEHADLSIVLRDLNLVDPSAGAYVYDDC